MLLLSIRSAKPGRDFASAIAFLFISLFILSGSSSTATVFEVPSQYSTVQAAITAANDGDLVLVAPGVYVEHLTVSKSLTLASWYFTTGDESYIDARG